MAIKNRHGQKNFFILSDYKEFYYLLNATKKFDQENDIYLLDNLFLIFSKWFATSTGQVCLLFRYMVKFFLFLMNTLTPNLTNNDTFLA